MPPVRPPRSSAPRVQPLALRTADGEWLAAEHWPRGHKLPARQPDGGPDLGIVVAHGFTGSLQRPAVQRASAAFARYGGVLAFDFRGHGASTGMSTVGDREVLDVDAAVAALRELGYARVATVGFSMGGSVVLRHAGQQGDRVHGHLMQRGVDAVVSVSAPSRWFYRGTPPMRRLHWVVERRLGREVARRVLRTRVAHDGWHPVPPSPVEVAGRIAPVPLVVVHGDRDSYFPVEHGEALFAAAREPREFWLLPGFGHAENAAPPELLDRIGARLRELTGCAEPAPNEPEAVACQ